MGERWSGMGDLSGAARGGEGGARALRSLPGSVVTRRTFLTAVGGLAAGGLCVLGMKSAWETVRHLKGTGALDNPLLAVYEHIQTEHGMWNYFPSEGELSEREREVADGLYHLSADDLRAAVEGRLPQVRLMLAYAPWVIEMYKAKWGLDFTVVDYWIESNLYERTPPNLIRYEMEPGLTWAVPNASLTGFSEDGRYGSLHLAEYMQYISRSLRRFFGDDTWKSVVWDIRANYYAPYANGPEDELRQSLDSFTSTIFIYLAPWYSFNIDEYRELYFDIYEHLKNDGIDSAPSLYYVTQYPDGVPYDLPVVLDLEKTDKSSILLLKNNTK